MKIKKIHIESLKILDWYIIKKFLGTYFFALGLILTVGIVFDMNDKLDKFTSQDVPLKEIIFDYYLHFIPYFANLFSSLFVFLSVIFFTSKLAENSEVIAMLSAGLSFDRLLRPYMVSATIIALLSIILSGFIIPHGNNDYFAFQNKYIDNMKVDNTSNIQFKIDDQTVAFMDRFNAGSNMGFRFSLESFDGKQLKSRLTAQNIQMDSLYHWKLTNYTIRVFEGMTERMVTGYEMDTVLRIEPSDFLISAYDAELMTQPRLHNYIEKQKKRGMGNVQQFQLEYHRRYAAIASIFIMTIIGASLSARKIKGGMGLNIGLGLLLSVSYILFTRVASVFSVSGGISPFLATWIPNIPFAIIALILYKKAPN